MPQNTNRIVIQLNQVAVSARQAELALRDYERQVERVNQARLQIAQQLVSAKGVSPAEGQVFAETLAAGGTLPSRITPLTGRPFRTTQLQREFQKRVSSLLDTIARETIEGVTTTGSLAQEQFNLVGLRDKEISALHRIQSSFVRMSKASLGGAEVRPELLERYRAVIEEKTANITRLNNEIDLIQQRIARFAQGGQTVTTGAPASQISINPATLQNLQRSTLTTGTTKGPKPAFSEEELTQLTKQYDELFRKANELGFASKDLRSVFKDPTTGAQEFAFAMRDVNGVIQKTNLILNRNGEIITQTQKKFRTFTDTITRNIREVAGWSVAIGLVYGSLYKLQDLVRIAIDNQAKLADVTIAMGNVTKDTSQIFENALVVAQQTGESLNGVIEAYAFAYRAVSQIADADKRTAAANELLTQSIVLSKLSTLDQAEAIDVLAGSLSQLRGPTETFEQSLERGTELLDKWVYLQTRANVSLDTLAVGFSITAESGVNAFDDVGDGINFTNAAIAVLAEKIGALGAKETGNAVRAIISGFTSDKTRNELNKFGISVTDVSGNLRSWLDISTEISNLYRTGIISSQQLNQIAFAIGGGNRRGQQVAAYLSDIERVNTLAQEQADSAKVNGFAQQALATKLDTVQTSITQLGNAFQGLAQSLGDEGGVLDTVSLLVNLLTDLVGVVDKVVASLGTLSIPTLLLLAQAGFSLASGKGGGFLGSFLGGGALGSIGNFFGGGGKPGFGIGALPYAAGQAARLAGKGLLTAGATSAFTALPYLQEGDYKSAGVAFGGAIIGTILAGGNPIGGLIGTAIADSFINQIGKHSDEISDYILTPEKFGFGETTTTGAPSSPATALGDLAALYAKQNLINAGLGENVNPDLIASFLSNKIVQSLGGFLGIETAKPFEGLNKDEVLAVLAGAEFQNAIRATTPVSQDEIRIDEFTRLQQETFNSIKDSLSAFRTTEKDTLFKQYVSGEGGVNISAKDYTTRIESLNTFAATVSSLITILEQDYGTTNAIVDELISNQQSLFETILNLSPEAQAEIANLIQTYKDLLNLSALAQEQGRTSIVDPSTGLVLSLDEINTKLQEYQTLIAGYVARSKEAQIVSRETLPATIQFPADRKYVGQVLERAGILEAAYLDSLTPDERTKFLAENKYAENILEIITEGGKIAYERLPQGIVREIFQKAFEQLQTEGAIPTADLGFQGFDITSQDFKNIIIPQYNQLLSQLSSFGYQADLQPLIQLFADGKIETNTYDWKIIQYLLQENNDLQRKQLDGIYNLPANASFYVPFTGYKLGNFTRDGEGTGGITTVEVPPELQTSAYTYDAATGTFTTGVNKFGAIVDELFIYGPEGYPHTSPNSPINYIELAKQFPYQLTPYGPPTPPGYGINNIFPSPTPLTPATPIPTDFNSLRNLEFPSFGFDAINQLSSALSTKPINTNLELRSTSVITLTLDRAVISRVVNEELARSIVNFNGVAGSATRSLVL